MENTLLNLIPAAYLPEIHLSQYDVGRTITFTLKDGASDYSVPSGASVKVKATKPSGFGFEVACTFNGGTVTLVTTDTMTPESGRFPAELSIVSGNTTIGTSNFIFNIERSPHPEGTIDGDAETIIPELTLLVERVEAAASSVLDMQVAADTLPPGSQATYSYDEELNKATFGIPQGEAGSGAIGTVASAYDATKTYAVGDYAIHNNDLYRCITAITTAEAFTASHWTKIVLADDVNGLKNDLRELNNGLQNFGLDYTFIHGYIYQGDATTGITYRFVPVDIMQYDKKITVNIANGFKVGYFLYHDDGTFYVKVADYTTPFTIAANQKFRIEIRRNPENTSEVASYAEFVGAVTFKSVIEEKFDSIDTDIFNAQNDINALESKFDKRLYVNENQIALTGSGQFVTKDFDIPCDDVGQPCCVFVGSTTNVTVTKPIRYRFIDANNVVVGSDKYIEVGKVGYLFCPSGATKFRVSLYGTVSGELVSQTAYFNNVKLWKGNPADDFINEVVPTPIFAESLAIEGYSTLPDNPLLPSIAHRGYSLTAPECTGSAVKEAKRRGFTGVENDVALTSDGKFVMWHDATLAKIGDSSHSIGDYTLAELKAMDFGAWKSPKYTGEKILTFAEWVLLAKQLGLKLYVDTKFEFTSAQIEELATIVNNNGMMDATTWYISFGGGYLAKLHELYPHARVLYLGTPSAEACQIIATMMETSGAHTGVICADSTNLNSTNYLLCHEYGVDLECYFVSYEEQGLTVEQVKDEIKRVSEFGLTGMVLDWYRVADVLNEDLL